MRRILSLAIVLIWAFAVPSVGFAQSYNYYAPISVRESSGTARTALPVIASINNAYLSSNTYVSISGLNTSFTTVTPSKWTVADDKLVFYVPSLQAFGTNSYQYNLGVSPAQTALAIVLGVGGSIQTADAAALECGTGCRSDLQGYLNTSYSGSNRYLFQKANAIELYVSAAGTLTARVSITPTTTTFYSSTSDAHIYNTNATYATAQAAATGTVGNPADLLVGQTTTYTVYRGVVYFDTSGLGAGPTITSATMGLYGLTNQSTTDFDVVVTNGQPTYPSDPLATGDYDKTHYSGNGGSFNTASYVAGYNNITLNATGLGWINQTGTTKLALRSSLDIAATQPTGADWVDFAPAETAGTGQDPKLTINYTPPSSITTVSFGSVASGDGYKVRMDLAANVLSLCVDTTLAIGTTCNTVAFTGTVADNANSWTWMGNDTTPYLDYIKYFVGASEVLKYEPVSIISGTTLPDRDTSDGTQNGAITWGTNPAGIVGNVTVGAIVPTTTTAPASVTAPQSSLVSPTGMGTLRCDAGSVASGTGLTNCTPIALTTLPFYPLFLAFSNATTAGGFTAIPVLWLYVVLSIPFTLGLSFGAYFLFRSAPTTAKIMSTIVCGLCVGTFTVMQIYPFWMLIVYLPGAVAFVLYDRVYSIG